VHNLIYWRGGDYIGIGPGAHGRITAHGIRQATVAPKAPGKWLELVEARRPGELAREKLTPKDHALEYLMMSLRLTEGLDLQRYAAIAEKPLKAEVVDALVDLGMVVTTANRLKATVQGRMVLNALIRELAED
jgi:oxygen-independent coproporphyrinogen-3 oxidase